MNHRIATWLRALLPTTRAVNDNGRGWKRGGK